MYYSDKNYRSRVDNPSHPSLFLKSKIQIYACICMYVYIKCLEGALHLYFKKQKIREWSIYFYFKRQQNTASAHSVCTFTHAHKILLKETLMLALMSLILFSKLSCQLLVFKSTLKYKNFMPMF